MDEMRKTDRLYTILYKASWSIGDTAFVGKEGMSWLVFGTKGDHSIRAEGKSQVEAWKNACRQAEEMGLVQPVDVGQKGG
jgi:hypothetical protein